MLSWIQMRLLPLIFLLSTLLMAATTASPLSHRAPSYELVDVRLVRLWVNITVTNPHTRIGNIEYQLRNPKTHPEVELSLTNIQPDKEIWILTIDTRGYSTTFENGVWMKELFESFTTVRPNSGILLGQLKAEPADLQQAKTRLYAALDKVPTEEIDILYIYVLLARITAQARGVGFTFGNEDPETMKKRYLPYMKVMMEGKGSGALRLITGVNEENKYRQGLARLFNV
ncbi:hypothetical protein C8J55DRAFT_264987 [Lentinula edodes]|uniref:rRNA N-glycosidase n=1 Tax=Lentinula lateritia TaxID=40482 RepID=A0A9W9DDI5_9AGAR|nr:hypothetical protein C8J55DRAFT_264987 [Lentinula edodes]